MELFEILKNELIGKKVYTNGNIKFEVKAVFKHYDNLKNHFNTNEDIKIAALLLIGIDDKGDKQELILANSKILDLFYF